MNIMNIAFIRPTMNAVVGSSTKQYVASSTMLQYIYHCAAVYSIMEKDMAQ